MKLLLSNMLLASFCTLCSWSVSPGTDVVTQSPDVSVLEGETVEITCCWKGGPGRRRVSWLKNHTQIKSDRVDYHNGSLGKEKSGCSNLTFSSITTEGSGRYTCRVTEEIPKLAEYEGNGTFITVRARENKKDNTTGASNIDLPLPVIISLAVGAPLILIAVVCFCTLRRRESRAPQVIYEVPHIDSEEADMDKHSTSSSRGSSQWCQVPMYESLDYFERVQTKESG